MYVAITGNLYSVLLAPFWGHGCSHVGAFIHTSNTAWYICVYVNINELIWISVRELSNDPSFQKPHSRRAFNCRRMHPKQCLDNSWSVRLMLLSGSPFRCGFAGPLRTQTNHFFASYIFPPDMNYRKGLYKYTICVCTHKYMTPVSDNTINNSDLDIAWPDSGLGPSLGV